MKMTIETIVEELNRLPEDLVNDILDNSFKSKKACLKYFQTKGEVQILPNKYVNVKVGTRSRCSSYKLSAVYEAVYEKRANPDWNSEWDKLPKGEAFDESTDLCYFIYKGKLWNSYEFPEVEAIRRKLGLSLGIHWSGGVTYDFQYTLAKVVRKFYDDPSLKEFIYMDKSSSWRSDVEVTKWTLTEDPVKLPTREYIDSKKSLYFNEGDYKNLHTDEGETFSVEAMRNKSLFKLTNGDLYYKGSVVGKFPSFSKIEEVEMPFVCQNAKRVFDCGNGEYLEVEVADEVVRSLSKEDFEKMKELNERCKTRFESSLFFKFNEEDEVDKNVLLYIQAENRYYRHIYFHEVFGCGKIICNNIKNFVKNGKLQLSVPDSAKGRVIGKQGQNIKKLTEELQDYCPELQRIVVK